MIEELRRAVWCGSSGLREESALSCTFASLKLRPVNVLFMVDFNCGGLQDFQGADPLDNRKLEMSEN